MRLFDKLRRKKYDNYGQIQDELVKLHKEKQKIKERERKLLEELKSMTKGNLP